LRRRAIDSVLFSAALLASAMGNTVTVKRTKAAIAEQRKFSALLKILRAAYRLSRLFSPAHARAARAIHCST